MARPVILVVEDEQDILDLVGYHLEQAGNKVLKATDGAEGLRLCRDELPDLVVLDLLLPNMEGKEVCRRIRRGAETNRIPVLILTAKAEEVDRIVGFEIGADDYMTKPFSPRELVLRVESILNRTLKKKPASNLIRFPGIFIDPDQPRVEIDNEEVSLTATEFKLLYYLASHAGRVQTREILLDQVWGYSFEGYARTVDTHVRRLRTKLGPLKSCIETVRGIGYRFRETDETETAPETETSRVKNSA
jgi:two-component system phosphate regulon response regulator PhoB